MCKLWRSATHVEIRVSVGSHASWCPTIEGTQKLKHFPWNIPTHIEISIMILYCDTCITTCISAYGPFSHLHQCYAMYMLFPQYVSSQFSPSLQLSVAWGSTASAVSWPTTEQNKLIWGWYYPRRWPVTDSLQDFHCCKKNLVTLENQYHLTLL